MDNKKGKKLTMEDGKQALHDHVKELALGVKEKYGSDWNEAKLKTLLQDADFVRFPTTLEFKTEKLSEGQFASALPVDEENPAKGYTIYIHEFFKDKPKPIAGLVLYHVVTVNYGSFADFIAAEIFAATVLELDQDEYYDWICQLADSIPK